MSRVAAGDRDACGVLVDRYMNIVFLFAFGIVKDRALAEDVTQETFVRLWRNAGSWVPTGRVKSWLMRIAHNLAIDEMRRHRPQVDIEAAEPLLPVIGPGQERQMQDKDTVREIKAAIMTLPERQRMALMLVYYSDCSGAEAAEILGITAHAFESLLSRGRKSLRALLEGRKEDLMERADAG